VRLGEDHRVNFDCELQPIEASSRFTIRSQARCVYMHAYEPKGDDVDTEHTNRSARRMSIDRRRPSRHSVLVAATVGVGLLAAACGGGSTPHGMASVGSTKSTTTTVPESSSVRYASCMRAHGVANFPDSAISVDGNQVQFNTPHGIKSEPHFASASRACARDLPGASSFPAKHVNVQAELAFSRCMRSHGITDFPDPLPGGGFNAPGNTNSPQFEAPARACQTTGVHWNGP
jgi:hypothetical protein